MESIFTTMTAVGLPPAEQGVAYAALAPVFSSPVSTPVLNPEELQTAELILMVSAMHRSICRLNKTSPAEYHLYCGTTDT